MEPRDAFSLASRAAALSTRLLEVTALVFRRSAPGESEPIGAAGLLAIGPIRFAFSSARVLNERDDHLYVQTGADLTPLEGDYSRIPSAADRRTDVGVIRLSGARWNSLPDSHFTQWLEIDHAGHFLMDYAFALVGYPLEKQSEEARFTPGLHVITALECGRRLYNQEGHDPNVHLLISLDKRRAWAGGGHFTTPAAPFGNRNRSAPPGVLSICPCCTRPHGDGRSGSPVP